MSLMKQMQLAHTPRATVDDVAKHGGHCKVICKDGFTMSVVAHFAAYCDPRPGLPEALGGAEDDYAGPFTHVEVGFPSVKPEPWKAWAKYADEEDDPTGTIYSYVPLRTVNNLVKKHGGYA